MTHKPILCSAIVSAALLSACATKGPLPPHAEVVNAIRKIETVAILPPIVEYTRMVFSGENERVPLVEQTIAGNLTGALEGLVEGKQFIIRKPLAEQTEEQKREMEFELQQLHAALGAAVRQGSQTEPENQETRPRVSIGAAATPLAHRMSADALLVTRYSGFHKSQGQRTKEAMSGIMLGALTGVVRVPASEGGVVSVALIDGATGEVLWVGRGSHAVFSGLGAPRRGASTAAGAASEALATFPTRGAAPAASGKPPASSAAQ